jgi:hypothetical protein
VQAPLVLAIQISKAFGAGDVLDGVSFRVAPGDRKAVEERAGGYARRSWLEWERAAEAAAC